MKADRLLLMIATSLTLASCKPASNADNDVLHVGSQRGGTKALMLASGVLDGAPYRIEWSEFAAAQPLLEAIGAGAVDVGIAGDAPFMFAYQSGSPIRAIGAQTVTQRPAGALALLVLRGSPVRSLGDLKGRKIATTRGSIGHYLVVRALEKAALPPDWVQFSFLSPGDARAAFSSGAVDGWAVWTPYVKPALDDGARIVVDGRDLVRGYGFDVANDKAVQGRRALLADFLSREAKALAWAKRNPGRFAEVLAQETGLPPAVARDMVEKNARSAVPIDDALVADQQQVIDTFRRAGVAKAVRPLAPAFDRSFWAAER